MCATQKTTQQLPWTEPSNNNFTITTLQYHTIFDNHVVGMKPPDWSFTFGNINMNNIGLHHLN